MNKLTVTLPDGSTDKRTSAHPYGAVVAALIVGTRSYKKGTTDTIVTPVKPYWKAESWHGTAALAAKAIEGKARWPEHFKNYALGEKVAERAIVTAIEAVAIVKRSK